MKMIANPSVNDLDAQSPDRLKWRCTVHDRLPIIDRFDLEDFASRPCRPCFKELT